MSESQSIVAGIAERYALALFELAREENNLGALEGDIQTLEDALKEGDELSDFISSPIIARHHKQNAIAKICKKAGIGVTMTNSLTLMAGRGRLFVLANFLKILRGLIDKEKGEVCAEVTSAVPLSKARASQLSKTLRQIVGKTVKINIDVDEELIGGLVVRVDSRMVDSSIRTKLLKLQNIMKEAG